MPLPLSAVFYIEKNTLDKSQDHLASYILLQAFCVWLSECCGFEWYEDWGSQELLVVTDGYLVAHLKLHHSFKIPA